MVLGYISSYNSRFLFIAPRIGPPTEITLQPGQLLWPPTATFSSPPLWDLSVKVRDEALPDAHQLLSHVRFLGRLPRSRRVPGSKHAVRRGPAVGISISTNRNLVVPIQHAYLNVFGTRLDDFEQTFNR